MLLRTMKRTVCRCLGSAAPFERFGSIEPVSPVVRGQTGQLHGFEIPVHKHIHICFKKALGAPLHWVHPRQHLAQNGASAIPQQQELAVIASRLPPGQLKHRLKYCSDNPRLVILCRAPGVPRKSKWLPAPSRATNAGEFRQFAPSDWI